MHGHLLVVDGDNVARRYFHGATSIPASEAFSRALGRYRNSLNPTHAVVVFDPLDGGSLWRREIWPQYKANRPPHPPGLDTTLQECRHQCRYWRVALALDDDHEADDLIGSYVVAGVRAGMAVTIVSSDKDLVQLVRDQPRVAMLDETRKHDWSAATVRAKFGVDPDRIPDLFALIGDSSDNYHGVPGIGSKTAARLLEEYVTLENLLERKNLVRSTKVMNLLREHDEIARTCQRLATLRTDLPLPVPLDGCEWARR